jgi:hypothetical protein
MRNNLLIALAIIAIIIGVLLPVVFRNCRDIPPPDTSDLALVRPEVAPEDNAYTYFSAISNVLYWPTNAFFIEKCLLWKSVSDDFITDVIGKNERALALIERGLACRICIIPEIPDFDSASPIKELSQAAGIMASKTRQARLAGRYPEATATCLALLKFGKMVRAGVEYDVEYHGTLILDYGLNEAQDLARDQNTPLDQLERLFTGLAALDPLTPGIVHAIKAQYRYWATLADRIRDGKKDVGNPFVCYWLTKMGRRPPVYFFQANKTKLIFADISRGAISNLPRFYAEVNFTNLAETLAVNKGIFQLIAKPNALGRIVCMDYHFVLEGECEHKCKFDSVIAATRLILACNIYRRKEGKLPADLQALVPAYLAAVPADPYDGKPFRYSAAKGVVYSVSKDLRDDGGSSPGDFVFELDFPKTSPAGAGNSEKH